ncbi:hypothetical protein TNCV_4112531 [Trichonephila clavipes]|nr:hypothetical protein TNCV_4112531 [Trichonephila clavipes]
MWTNSKEQREQKKGSPTCCTHGGMRNGVLFRPSLLVETGNFSAAIGGTFRMVSIFPDLFASIFASFSPFVFFFLIGEGHRGSWDKSGPSRFGT